jgi:hypothetical protein
VQSVTYFGAMLKYQVQVPELGEIEVDVDAWRGGAPAAEGTAVDLSWADAAAVQLQSEPN